MWNRPRRESESRGGGDVISLFFIRNKMINKTLAKKLNIMAAVDQKMRRRVNQAGAWNSKIRDIDQKNTGVLKKIIRYYGWPTIRMVGRKASFNAWLLTQHSDHDLLFQKRVLKILRDIYKRNKKDIDPANIAFLTDRILVAEGKKQLFGTQFFLDASGVFCPRPIRDMQNIERRRRTYGLRPFARDVAECKKVKPPSLFMNF